ncbi:hypothetical protein FNW02_05330 [Komarekiella sp. 'clone 1']|uniref:Uncharacterized protein n=1 Tax=Komarekiella delphini-convector SJRDD-AB1 TaxID=2593771 RepID=A0AA40SU34_9NOST|nr:hypothetical protein [Komarekiella delphini-convector]MBD6615281.1 hypothetical protein [Komarekiella delphini-convector SJRDD-AB1]MBW4685524.1 hypothetical protein [Komarekiella atlantica HA4396-MV6]
MKNSAKVIVAAATISMLGLGLTKSVFASQIPSSVSVKSEYSKHTQFSQVNAEESDPSDPAGDPPGGPDGGPDGNGEGGPEG